MIEPFSIARLPRIVFGDGSRRAVAAEAGALGRRALVVTGAGSLRATPHWRELADGLAAEGVSFEVFSVAGEPSPEMVDGAVAEFRDSGVEAVVGIGGGSALDAAKAIAGLLPHGNSVLDHLEGVGAGIPYRGPAVPFIAVPTTAGTGSEATKNAVLSRHGDEGFKKSFRDEALVARVAIVDPELLASCPPDLIAANGMDAFTQLLESLVSANANPMTDALAWSGLAAFRDGFFSAWEGDGAAAAAGRAGIAYASLTSGITLAQVGLGSVHGLASPLGAFFPIPHGVVCGTLVAEATEVNIRALKERDPESPALDRYSRAGALIAETAAADHEAGLDVLVTTLRQWTERLALPGLGTYGMTAADIPRVVANCRGGSMKTNPIVLNDDEVAEVLTRRL